MGMLDKIMGPRRDNPDVQAYTRLRDADPEPWTADGRRRAILERRLGSRACEQLDRERR